jgi:hypothetical protein
MWKPTAIIRTPKAGASRNIIFMSAIIFLLGGQWLYADTPPDLIEIYPEGSINWTQGRIDVQASCQTARGQDKTQAGITFECARNAARHRLANTLLALTIDADTTVNDYVGRGHLQAAKLQGMIEKARVLDPVVYTTDGTVTLHMRLSIHKGLSQLILPEEIGHVETITRVISPEGKETESAEMEFTGLLVDARGLGLQPALAPKIVDENGMEVYGPTFVSRSVAVQGGMLMYLASTGPLDAARRTGINPLRIRGLRSAGANRSDIIISNPDAARIKSLPDLLQHLKQGRVAIVFDEK